jgi:hypothetical protein
VVAGTPGVRGLDWLLALFLALLNFGINWRIFLPGVTPYRGSIERGYAYMAALVAQHPNPWAWNPMQYCGLPTHFVYLPLLPYWNAIWLRLWPALDSTQVHRVTCAAALCVAVGGVFLFVRYFGASRTAAFAAGLAVTTLSPLYLLIQTIEKDRGIMEIPWRIQVLIKYGEGPHTVGLALIPLALIAVHRCATTGTFGALWLAAVALAAVVLTNWVAGLALALLVVIQLLSYGSEPGYSLRRPLLAGVLGYLLAAFWLTPTFVLRMMGNWPKDAFGYQFQTLERFAMGGWVAGVLVLWLLSRWLWPKHRYLAFLLQATFCFGLLVSLFYGYGLNVIPESRRYALEYELFLILLACELLRLAYGRWRWATGFVLLVLLLNRTPAVTHFLAHRYKPWVPVERETTPEYQVAVALAARQPVGRLTLSGGSRFRFNSWFGYPQIGGVFETGLRNRIPVDIAYQVRTDIGSVPGEEAASSILQLRALAVEYLVVHGPESQEFYRDLKFPNKFEGVLEKVWSAGDDRIYRLGPVRYAHVVKPAELPAYPPRAGYFKVLAPYVNAMLDPARPALEFAWHGTSAATITGAVRPGDRIAVAISYDDGWEARQNGKLIPLEPNQLGFFTLSPEAGERVQIELRYRVPIETPICAAVSALSWLGCLLYWRRSRRTHA